jgi:UDP-N-acetylglucosamine--dolichyl-phosphate N-acetylglucosaminephosphotransferase
MEQLLIVPIILGFLITLFFIPYWIKKAKQIGLVWEDMNKKEKKKEVAGSGGIIVIMGFIMGVLTYIAIKTFILKIEISNIEIFALLTTVLIAGIIGFVDDIFGWIHGGLSAKFRIFLILFSAIPLMVINAGESNMLGIEFGLLYPLFFIPLGILGASVTFNFLAGYNGLETSQGILILSSFSLITYLTGTKWLSLICLIMVFCLIAFYIFNKYPAKVFPGDALTYSIGALIAVVAILGNIEKIAIFFFIPYMIETGLKVRGKLKKESFAKVNEDGSLEIPYKKFYGLEHIAIYLLKKIKRNQKVNEKDVVYFLNLFQLFIILLGFALFKKALF